jgi:metal-responsive CopG/Arc/MetJ family transcriptional regulator
LDYSKATRPGLEMKRVTVDLPAHMLEKLDYQAGLRGVTRQSLIKMWLYEKLEKE